MANPENEDDLRTALREVYANCNENCSRAYYVGERDHDDHEATNALKVLGPLLTERFRDALREAFAAQRMLPYPGEVDEQGMDFHDHKVEVALEVFRTFTGSAIAAERSE